MCFIVTFCKAYFVYPLLDPFSSRSPPKNSVASLLISMHEVSNFFKTYSCHLHETMLKNVQKYPMGVFPVPKTNLQLQSFQMLYLGQSIQFYVLSVMAFLKKICAILMEDIW